MRKLPALTAPQTLERVKMIKKAKTSGQMFYATGGQHLNSDEFFQARALADRQEVVLKLQRKKEKRLLLLKLHQDARELLATKGPLTPKLQQAICTQRKTSNYCASGRMPK